MYDDDSGMPAAVSKTIKINDCMKGSKKFSINNDQIAKFVKVKDHTKTWIKTVEKTAKTRNEHLDQLVINYDYPLGHLAVNEDHIFLKTPLEYAPKLQARYCCSYCGQHSSTFTVEYHDTLTHQYVLLCNKCCNK